MLQRWSRSGSGKPKVEADYYALAETRGFEWIGDSLPANTKAKTRWRCAAGHEWEALYDNIRTGTGCPECWRLRRGKKKNKKRG